MTEIKSVLIVDYMGSTGLHLFIIKLALNIKKLYVINYDIWLNLYSINKKINL